MRRSLRLFLLFATSLVAPFVAAPAAEAAYVVTCWPDYFHESGSEYESHETGYGVGECNYPVYRIDVRLTYVYCTSSSSSSCNTTGSNFANSDFHRRQVVSYGGIYNLRGWYKAIIRTSFTMYGDQVFYSNYNCGQSGTNYYSCAVETNVFYRGGVA